MTSIVADVDFEYASSIAAKAMLCMSEHRVAATPDHFRIWYSYCQGSQPVLKRAIDILISNKQRFTAQVLRDLASTYVDCNTSPEAFDSARRLGDVMSKASQFVSSAASSNKEHLRELEEIGAKSEIGLDPLSLIKSLIAEVSRASARATTLEKSLASTSLELDSIRTSLAKAEEQSKTDTLTGLPNRRALEDFFRTAQINAMERGVPLSALLIDIDHFKRFNDTYGHNVGDQVLRLVAHALQEHVRQEDLVARYGGEELIAILPGADLPACFARAEQIRLAIDKCEIKRRSTGEALSSVTVSIGVGQFRPGEPMSELIERCDQALYLAKRSGRNQTFREDQLTLERTG
jgi:diguanylate cyclase